MTDRMQRHIKVKTDYKHSRGKQPYFAINISTKWALPLAFTILAFALIWRFSSWEQSYDATQDEQQEWVDENQVTLDVALPESEEETLLIQPTTIAENTASLSKEWQSFTIKAGDNLAYYFQEAGLDSKVLQEVLSIKNVSQHLKKIYPGQTLRIQADSNQEFQALQFDVDPLTTLIVERQNGTLISHIEDKPIEKRVAFGGGRIQDSFFVAGKHAKLDDALIMELAKVFAYDIDFALDIKPNDYFKVLFEEYFVNGVKVGNGPIVAAEFVNNGNQYRAIRYTDSNGETSYYSPSGKSLKKAFIRTPVQYTRISSHFNLHRRHPVLHKIRAHKGVDYAAPTGTPVKAAGSGKVVFVGKKGGYGNAIILQHGSKYTTLYGHLSKFSKSLKKGNTIKQGQIIGYVGSTGLASGPHLHFEFRIDGVHHDPLKVALPQADGISGKAKTQFLAYSNNLLRMMDHQAKVVVAAND
ncbi:MAG: peptidoglycan DD-metalloendopeptidase family protein [Gammaproteobacteria bacterium]|jgi:murein DD-endopeptidase MepM/ murein hydrolase activator NlpD|nr:peptidoglycan DD-metalloendopeptidase family protein [Gammaproteobacteria bacterium]